MTTTNLPVFMSVEHVETMNRLLAESADVTEAIAKMPRAYEIAYRLDDAVAGRTEYWLMHLGPDGAWFGLDPAPSADLTFVGDYHRMIDATKASRGGEELDPGLETIGDLGVMEAIAEVFAVAQKVGTVPVSWPV